MRQEILKKIHMDDVNLYLAELAQPTEFICGCGELAKDSNFCHTCYDDMYGMGAMGCGEMDQREITLCHHCHSWQVDPIAKVPFLWAMEQDPYTGYWEDICYPDPDFVVDVACKHCKQKLYDLDPI